MLTEVVGGLDADDPTRTTAVLARLTDLLARRNTIRAVAVLRTDELQRSEQSAAFQAAIGVLAQRSTASLMTALDPASCDAALTTLTSELEGLEVRFGAVSSFAELLDARRTELHDAFAVRRDSLVAERASRIDRLVASARRAIATVAQRASALGDRAEIEAFFVADPLVARVRSMVKELDAAGEASRAEELTVALAGRGIRPSASQQTAVPCSMVDRFGSAGGASGSIRRRSSFASLSMRPVPTCG